MGSLSNSIPIPTSPRINQLDAAMLDNEIVQHVSEQLKSALAYIPSHRLNASPSTLSAIADVLFFLATTARQLPTPGQSMLYVARRVQPLTSCACSNTLCMNIRLCSVSQAKKRAKSSGRRRAPESVGGLSLKRRMAFMAIACVLPLAADAVISRLARPLRADESEQMRVFRDRFRTLLVAARNLARLLSVVNAYAFIRHGYFRTLPARIAGGCALAPPPPPPLTQPSLAAAPVTTPVFSVAPHPAVQCYAFPRKSAQVATHLSSFRTSHSFGKVDIPAISHPSSSYNRNSAISDFIQFVRVTVPISSWISLAVSAVRGQAQRLLPLVVSSRRHLCAVCGQLPSALPMVSVYVCSTQPLSTDV